MTYKEYKNDSFNLYTIKTDKFKTCHMEIMFYNKLEEKRITSQNVLADMLVHSSSKYKKRKYVVEKLEDLYSASFYSVPVVVGNTRIINFVYNFIDPVYAEKSYFKEAIKFPFEMIFNPNIKNDEFDCRTLKIIKSRVLAEIKSVKESPLRYAIKRAIINTDKTAPAAIETVGNIKDLNKINSLNLVDEYKYLLDNYYCDIVLVGNLNMDQVNLLIKEVFNNFIIKTNKVNPITSLKIPNTLINVKEKDNFEQSNLVCLYTHDNLSDFEKNYVIPIFNSIFGSGSLSNKLFQNLREKNSLCYRVSSFYQRYDQFMFITAGIDSKNANKAIKLIKKSLKEMCDGKFSQDDVDNAIKIHINNIKYAMDNPSSLIGNYFFHNLVNYPFLHEQLDNIDKVSKKDIINLAKKFKLITVYLLEGDK